MRTAVANTEIKAARKQPAYMTEKPSGQQPPYRAASEDPSDNGCREG